MSNNEKKNTFSTNSQPYINDVITTVELDANINKRDILFKKTRFL